MISNYILRSKEDSILAERNILVKRKIELIESVKKFGVTKQAAWKHRSGKSDVIDDSIIKQRSQLSKELSEVDLELSKIKAAQREINNERESERNKVLLNIFKEIFDEKQLNEIYTECTRRMTGDNHFKISFAWKELEQYKQNSVKYKKELIKQLDKMIEFRILLTGLIDKGCDQFGKAEFLKFISPLNTHIIPVNELEKIKQKIIG